MSSQDKAPAEKIQIFQRINKLRIKAGLTGDAQAGIIDATVIQKAQAVIDEKEAHAGDEMGESLTRLSAAWQEARKLTGEEARKQIDRVYNYANNIKDLAETYNFGLLKHFSESLRDFCEKIDITNRAHHTIVQAHIDVMQVAYNDDIKHQDGTKAEELKNIVAKAIGKYS